MSLDMNVVKKLRHHHTPIREMFALMYENTAEDGTLQVPYTRCSVALSEDEVLLTTRMDWDLPRFEKSVEGFYALVDVFKAMAPHYAALWEEGADPAALLTDPVMAETYRLFGIPLDNGDFDIRRLWDIDDRIGTVRLVEDAKALREQGKLDEEGYSFIREYEGITVSEEEYAYAAAYNAHLCAEAKKRMGDRAMAYDFYLRGQRLWRLLGIGAPDLVLRMEARQFAIAHMIHYHGTEPQISAPDADWDEE